MTADLSTPAGLIKLALACKCPRCGEGALYPPGLNIVLNKQCPVCGMELARNDNGDGPAVFLVFVLGFTLVPLALIADHLLNPPLWLLGAVFGAAALVLTLGALRPLKAYVIALQYKHRPGAWKKQE